MTADPLTGFQTNLLQGLATYLAAAGIGATYSTTGAYTADQLGIVLGNIPTQPDRVITLTSYGVGDDPKMSDSEIAVQVRCRWAGADKRPSDNLADLIFNLMHGKWAWTLGSGAAAVYVGYCRRNSGPVSLGQDQNNRWSNSQNFYMSVWRPSTNRT